MLRSILAKKESRPLFHLRTLGLPALGIVLVLVSWGCRRTAEPISAEESGSTFRTPYRNVAAGVKYVGDRACAACHADKAETYRHHPMGYSFPPVAAVAAG